MKVKSPKDRDYSYAITEHRVKVTVISAKGGGGGGGSDKYIGYIVCKRGDASVTPKKKTYRKMQVVKHSIQC